MVPASTTRRLSLLRAHLQGAPAAAAVAPVANPTLDSIDARLGKAASAGLIKISPISLHVGAVVEGIDLKKELSPEQIQVVYDALVRHKVLVFHNADLNHEQQVRFTRELSTASPNVGPPTIGHTVFGHVDNYPEIFSVYQGERNRPRNLDSYDGSMYNARPWTGFHCDITACVNPPCIGMLRGDIIPPNAGDTQFGNLAAAYEGLSDPIKALVQNLRAEHLFNEGLLGGRSGNNEYAASIRSRKMVTHHPMAVVHPDTGEKILFVSPIFLKNIVGVKPRESEQILEMLWEHSVRPEYTLRHKWTEGDLVVWDERSTTHRAPTDVFQSGYERQLYRTTLLGQPLRGVDGSVSTIVEGLPMRSCEEEIRDRPTTWEQGRETLKGSGNHFGR